MICWFGAIIDHDIELLQKIYLCFNAEIFRDQNDEIKEKSDVKMTEIVTFCLKEILYRYLLFVTLFSMQWKLICLWLKPFNSVLLLVSEEKIQ